MASAADQVSLGEGGEPRYEDCKAHPGRRQLVHFSKVRSFVVYVWWFLNIVQRLYVRRLLQVSKKAY